MCQLVEATAAMAKGHGWGRGKHWPYVNFFYFFVYKLFLVSLILNLINKKIKNFRNNM